MISKETEQRRITLLLYSYYKYAKCVLFTKFVLLLSDFFCIQIRFHLLLNQNIFGGVSTDTVPSSGLMKNDINTTESTNKFKILPDILMLKTFNLSLYLP